MVRSLVGILFAGVVLATGHDGAAAEPGRTAAVFPYRQRELLRSRDPSGGLAYVTSGAVRGETLPVVVFLHGLNAREEIHMWLGSPRVDLRAIADELVRSKRSAPFILAAPTHTRFATDPAALWPRFDLGDFLDATEAALGESARIDRNRVIVVGHSAAGCNTKGGLTSEGIASARPMALVAVDTCVSSELAALAETVPTRFYWQHLWGRPIDDFARQCERCVVEEVTDLPRGYAHDAILPEAFRRALVALLPASKR